MYFIEKITDKNGIIRTDDKYPNRIGSMAIIEVYPTPGYSMIFRYIKEDAYGNVIEDHITVTSSVENIKDNSEYLVINTKNSIYYFKKYKEE